MENAAKIIDFPVEKVPSSPNPSWAFHTDMTQNWAYWDKAFSPEECRKIIEIGESKILKTATVSKENQKNKEIRDSEIAWLSPSDDMEWVYRRVTDIVMNLNDQFFKFDLFGIVEGFQFTKYEAPSGFYGMHIDKTLGSRIRKLSLTIQLSEPDDYEGGELAFQFSKDQDVMPKEQGKLIAFPSYVVHEVKPVTKGTRYSLVAWITGKPFK